jgi:hypothetical protein
VVGGKIPLGKPSKRLGVMDVMEINYGYKRWMDFVTVARHDIRGVLFSNFATGI